MIQRVVLALAFLVANVVLSRPTRAADPAPAEPAAEPAKDASIDVLLMGYYIWAKPDYIALCKEAGVNIHLAKKEDFTAADPANYPLDYLKTFDVIVVSGPMEKPWDPQITRGEIMPGVVDNLLAYNQLGGGLVWVPLAAGYGALTWNESTGSRIDATALDESLDGPANFTYAAVSESLRDKLTYFWTTEITPHPVTEGVRGLFMGTHGEWGWPGTIPMRFGASWQTLVTGMAETRTVTNATPIGQGQRGHKPSGETGTYAAKPAIIAVRPETADRAGRMMVLPIYTTWTWGNYAHPAMKEAFLQNGDGIHPSDGQRFLLNAWRWLAEPATAAGLGGATLPPPADNAGGPDLAPAEWQADLPAASVATTPALRGLFGAQSAYGGGAGTVAEWVAAAKAAGLDYLAFTDDLTALTPATYQALIDDCAAASDDTFLAIPGFGAEDLNGVYRFFPGISKLPQPARLTADGRLAEPIGVALDSTWTSWQIPARLDKMPYNPWWEHVVSACAPLVYDGTTLVDDSVETWYRDIEANNMHLLPLSLVHVREPGALAAAVQAAHVTVLNTSSNADIVSKVLRAGFSGQVFPSYLTNGPEILAWHCQEGATEPYRPDSARFRLILKLQSAVGIREVRIFDAETGEVYRDWQPDGAKDFFTTVDDAKDRARVLGLIVTDVNGRTAIAPPAYPQMQSNRVWHMGDRLMGLQHVTSWNREGTELIGSIGSAIGIGYHKGAIGEAAGEFSTQHNRALKFQGLEGAGVYPPAFKFNTTLTAPGHQVSPAFRYQIRLSGHDLTVIDYIGDHTLVKGAKFNFNAPPPAREPTALADITVRTWLLRQPYMADSQMMLNEVTVRFKEACTPSAINLARYNGPGTAGDFNFLAIRPSADGDTSAWSFDEKEKFRHKTNFSLGGYLYQAPMLAGTMAFIALDDMVSINSEARHHRLVLNPKLLREYQPGEEIKVQVLRVSRAFEAEQASTAWLQQLIRDYGIGSAPAYPYTVLQGTVKEIRYIMDLQAQDGGAAVEIGKYPLVSTLPLRVNGIRERAFCGEYDLATKRVRPLPVFEGSVTTSVDPMRQSTRLYIGEWLTWDNPDARLSLATQGLNFLLDAHNPTDAPLTVTVTGAPGFAPLKGLTKSFTLPPHSSIKETLTSAPDSVKLVPLRY